MVHSARLCVVKAGCGKLSGNKGQIVSVYFITRHGLGFFRCVISELCYTEACYNKSEVITDIYVHS